METIFAHTVKIDFFSIKEQSKSKMWINIGFFFF